MLNVNVKTSKFHLPGDIPSLLRLSKTGALVLSLLLLYSKYTEESRENKSDILECCFFLSVLAKGLLEDEL